MFGLWCQLFDVWYHLMLYGIFLFLKKTGDQPERRDLNYIMVGISNFSSRFGYSGYLNTIVQHLPPCESCFKQMSRNSFFLKSNILCEKCVNCNMMKKRPLMLFDPPEN